MRAETRKKYIPILLLVVLAALIPLTYLRCLAATLELSPEWLTRVTGVSSQITDRTGQVLFDGSNTAEDVLGNLVGESGLVDNSLYTQYERELSHIGFDPLLGLDSVTGEEITTLQTTLLPAASLEKIKAAFAGYNGCCFAYNYRTGEVYTALSLPCNLTDNSAEPGFSNRCLSSLYIPGSTMKIVALLCALEQNKSLADFTFTCTGSHALPDGTTVKCHSVHGTIGLKQALGWSCNCYMAALAEQLNVKTTQKTLNKLEIFQTDDDRAARWGSLDRLSVRTSRTEFRSASQYNSVWSLVGQGNSQVSPVNMAMIAAAAVNEGTAARPYVVQTITAGDGSTSHTAQQNRQVRFLTANTARQAAQVWSRAVEDHYRTGVSAVDKAISHAKTGTAQKGTGSNNRLLLGAMEEYSTAFFIVVEDLPSGNGIPSQIANTLAREVAAMA